MKSRLSKMASIFILAINKFISLHIRPLFTGITDEDFLEALKPACSIPIVFVNTIDGFVNGTVLGQCEADKITMLKYFVTKEEFRRVLVHEVAHHLLGHVNMMIELSFKESERESMQDVIRNICEFEACLIESYIMNKIYPKRSVANRSYKKAMAYKHNAKLGVCDATAKSIEKFMYKRLSKVMEVENKILSHIRTSKV